MKLNILGRAYKYYHDDGSDEIKFFQVYQNVTTGTIYKYKS